MREAINSALAQTYNNVEIIVVNDGSNDEGETERIAISYGDKIRYYCKANGGVASALNFGIEHMHGEYFSWLSHDDVYLPDKIFTQLELINNLTDKKAIVFAGFIVIDQYGHEINRILPLVKFDRTQLETPLFALLHGMIGGCSLLIHKSHFERVGLFREDLPTTQDFDLWFRMMRNMTCYVCEGALHMTRVHNMQGSKIQKKVHAQESNALWIQMMETLTEEEMIQMDGSVRRFYRYIFVFLTKYSSCRGAIKYAKKKASEINGRLCLAYQLVLDAYNIGLMFCDLINTIAKQGLGNTFKRACYWVKRVSA